MRIFSLNMWIVIGLQVEAETAPQRNRRLANGLAMVRVSSLGEWDHAADAGNPTGPGCKFLLNVRREYRFILATFAASGIGYLGSAAAPVIVNALIEAGLDHQQAGDLGTIELLTLAVASTLITPYVPIVSHRKLAVGGTLIAALGLVISALSVGYTSMIVGRIATGLGSGLAISGANAAVAAREDAERVFAIIWTMGGAVTASLAMYLPGVVDGGEISARIRRASSARFHRPAVHLLASRTSRSRSRSQLPRAPTRRPALRGARILILEAVFGPLVLMAFAGMFIYSAAEQALWNFAYNLPIEAGVDPALAAKILAFTTVIFGSRGRSHRGSARCAAGADLSNRRGLPSQCQWPLVVHQFRE